MYGRTTTTVSAPASAPMDLNSGKPDWRELAPLMGLVFILVLPTMLGGAMVVANWPREEMSGWRALWLGGGVVLVCVFGSFILMLRGAISREIISYQRRKDDWHYATLEKYEAGDGMITAQQVSEWRYNPADMRMVGALFFWLLVEQPRSPTIESLTRGPLLLNLGHRSVKIMDMTQDDAADALNLLAAAGLIAGRGPRKAGTLALTDAPQLAKRLALEAAKNPQLIVVPEVEK